MREFHVNSGFTLFRFRATFIIDLPSNPRYSKLATRTFPVYIDFIDIYGALDDNERQRYETDYPTEANTVSSYFQQARADSEQRGVQKGEVLVLLRQLRLKFGEIPEAIRQRVEAADSDTLLTWSERILTAERIDDVLR